LTCSSCIACPFKDIPVVEAGEKAFPCMWIAGVVDPDANTIVDKLAVEK